MDKENEKTTLKKITIRITEREHTTIKNKAYQSRLTLNEYVKKSALDKDIIVVDGLKDLLVEIKKIGVNVNQIARKLNQTQNINEDEKKYLKEGMTELWQLLRQFAENKTTR